MTSSMQPEQLSEQDQLHVDVAKDAFQLSWQSGRRQRIEDLCQSFPKSLQSAVMFELLRLE